MSDTEVKAVIVKLCVAHDELVIQYSGLVNGRQPDIRDFPNICCAKGTRTQCKNKELSHLIFGNGKLIMRYNQGSYAENREREPEIRERLKLLDMTL